jgi:hypothetical protein
MIMEIFEYSNAWSAPRWRFLFKTNIGDSINALALSLNLLEYNQSNSLFELVGSITVSGHFTDVRKFGEQIETLYGSYLTSSNTDWDYYQNYLEETND